MLIRTWKDFLFYGMVRKYKGTRYFFQTIVISTELETYPISKISMTACNRQ